jgi:hypothetical protein
MAKIETVDSKAQTALRAVMDSARAYTDQFVRVRRAGTVSEAKDAYPGAQLALERYRHQVEQFALAVEQSEASPSDDDGEPGPLHSLLREQQRRLDRATAQLRKAAESLAI